MLKKYYAPTVLLGPKYWICVDLDCEQFEHITSSDATPKCPACKQEMRWLEPLGDEPWTEENTRDLPRSYVNDSPFQERYLGRSDPGVGS